MANRLNQAQRIVLAVVLPILVAVPFFWDTRLLSYASETRYYLAFMAAVGVGYTVLCLLGFRPWQRLRRETLVVLVPGFLALLTAMAILLDRSWPYFQDPAMSFFGLAIFVFTGEWFTRYASVHGSPWVPPTSRLAYIGFIVIAFLGEQHLLNDVFTERALPYWFATVLAAMVCELVILRSPVLMPGGAAWGREVTPRDE